MVATTIQCFIFCILSVYLVNISDTFLPKYLILILYRMPLCTIGSIYTIMYYVLNGKWTHPYEALLCGVDLLTSYYIFNELTYKDL